MDRRFTHLLPLLVAILLSACGQTPPEVGDDTIELLSNDGSDEAIILMDGSRGSGCINDVVERANTNLVTQNLVTRSGCMSEIVVLSDDDRMTITSPVQPAWSNAANEVHQIDLDEVHAIPVTIWLVDPSPVVRTGFQANAQVHQARVLQLFNINNTGIGFDFTERVIDDAAQVNIVRDTIQQIVNTKNCVTGPVENDAAIFDEQAINVYYATFTGVNGIACGSDFIGMTAATPETLAHEIGHTLDLRHYGSSSSDNGNVMWWTGVQNRDNLTVGQAVRANLNPASGLNTLAVRNGLIRHCLHDTISPDCPDITLDVIQK